MSDTARRLTRERYYPVCAPGLAERDPARARLMDCAGTTGSWRTWCASAGLPFVRGGEVSLASTFVIAIEAARAGAGLTMAHDSVAGDLLAAGALVRPFDHAPRLAEAYFLLPPSSHAATPASRAVADWLLAEIAAAGDGPEE